MFTWDTGEEVHGGVVGTAGARLYGDLPEAMRRPAQAADDGATYYDARLRGQPVRMVDVVVPVAGGPDLRLRVA